jgi:hypothetical protein
MELAEEAGRSLMKQTRERYFALPPRIRTHFNGYFPLFGPPFEEAKLAIISQEPGSGSQVLETEIHPEIWPAEVSYVNSTGKLASALREVIPMPVLATALVTVIQPFRIGGDDDWRAVEPPSLRKEIEAAGLKALNAFLHRAMPQAYLLVGSKARDAFSKGLRFGEDGFLKTTLNGKPCIATNHLSGMQSYRVRKSKLRAEIENLLKQ